jgi:hypothetical protein
MQTAKSRASGTACARLTPDTHHLLPDTRHLIPATALIHDLVGGNILQAIPRRTPILLTQALL